MGGGVNPNRKTKWVSLRRGAPSATATPTPRPALGKSIERVAVGLPHRAPIAPRAARDHRHLQHFVRHYCRNCLYAVLKSLTPCEPSIIPNMRETDSVSQNSSGLSCLKTSPDSCFEKPIVLLVFSPMTKAHTKPIASRHRATPAASARLGLREVDVSLFIALLMRLSILFSLV